MALSWLLYMNIFFSDCWGTPKYKVGPTGPHKKFQPFCKSMVVHLNDYQLLYNTPSTDGALVSCLLNSNVKNFFLFTSTLLFIPKICLKDFLKKKKILHIDYFHFRRLLILICWKSKTNGFVLLIFTSKCFSKFDEVHPKIGVTKVATRKNLALLWKSEVVH